MAQWTPDQVNAALQQAGMDPQTAKTATDAWSSLPSSTVSSVGDILSGKATANSVIPLIAAGAAATGVGAPAVAAVAGAIAVIGSIASALFGGGDAKCLYNVGYVCFFGPRPSGPQDSIWKSFASFDDSNDDAGGCRPVSFQGPGQLPVPGISAPMICRALPWYFLVLCDEGWLNSRSDQDIADYFQIDAASVYGLKAFYELYLTLWKKNAEYALNGFPAASEAALLDILQRSWNQKYDASKTITIQPKGGDGSAQCFGGTLIDLIVGGYVGGTRMVPFTINMGGVPTNALLNIRNIRLVFGGGSSSTSTGTKVATGAAAIGGAAALSVLAYSWIKGRAVGAVLEQLWKGVKKAAHVK